MRKTRKMPEEMKLVISPQAAEGEALKSQDEWLEYWNSKGKYFASMPDFYRALRQGSISLSHAVSSTRILFEDGHALEGEVMHNFGSDREWSPGKVLVPPYFALGKDGSVEINERILHLYDEIFRGADLRMSVPDEEFIPRLFAASLKKPLVVGEKECLAFLQALFGTEDSLEGIAGVLYSALRHEGYTTRVAVDTYMPTHEGVERPCGFYLQIDFANKRLNYDVKAVSNRDLRNASYEAIYTD